MRSSNGGVWTPELGYIAPAILDSASDGLICLSVPDNSLNMDPYRYPVEVGDPVRLSPIRTTNAGQGFQGPWRPKPEPSNPLTDASEDGFTHHGRAAYSNERRIRSRVPTWRSDTMREVASLTMDMPAVNC